MRPTRVIIDENNRIEVRVRMGLKPGYNGVYLDLAEAFGVVGEIRFLLVKTRVMENNQPPRDLDREAYAVSDRYEAHKLMMETERRSQWIFKFYGYRKILMSRSDPGGEGWTTLFSEQVDRTGGAISREDAMRDTSMMHNRPRARGMTIESEEKNGSPLE